jgi:hypothetical protein
MKIMDIASLSTAIARGNIATDVNIALMKKSIDLARAQGENMVKLIEAAAVPAEGTIDITM